ncbi:MAG: hypothetical protein Q4E37_00320 [Tissierellia bacterium]|nr:hypothetical protein [Tissierellia bacterium]
MKKLSLSQKITWIAIGLLVLSFLISVLLDRIYLKEWIFRPYLWMVGVASCLAILSPLGQKSPDQ